MGTLLNKSKIKYVPLHQNCLNLKLLYWKHCQVNEHIVVGSCLHILNDHLYEIISVIGLCALWSEYLLPVLS